VPAEDQGRIQGFNYAVNTVAWATGPYAYWCGNGGNSDGEGGSEARVLAKPPEEALLPCQSPLPSPCTLLSSRSTIAHLLATC